MSDAAFPRHPPLSPYQRLVFTHLRQSRWREYVEGLSRQEAEEFRVWVRASAFRAMEEMGVTTDMAPEVLQEIRAHYARPLGSN